MTTSTNYHTTGLQNNIWKWCKKGVALTVMYMECLLLVIGLRYFLKECEGGVGILTVTVLTLIGYLSLTLINYLLFKHILSSTTIMLIEALLLLTLILYEVIFLLFTYA